MRANRVARTPVPVTARRQRYSDRQSQGKFAAAGLVEQLHAELGLVTSALRISERFITGSPQAVVSRAVGHRRWCRATAAPPGARIGDRRCRLAAPGQDVEDDVAGVDALSQRPRQAASTAGDPSLSTVARIGHDLPGRHRRCQRACGESVPVPIGSGRSLERGADCAARPACAPASARNARDRTRSDCAAKAAAMFADPTAPSWRANSSRSA